MNPGYHFQGVETGCNFGDHPSPNDSIFYQQMYFVLAQFCDTGAIGIANILDIAKEDQRSKAQVFSVVPIVILSHLLYNDYCTEHV
jgi:hypothetical protein